MRRLMQIFILLALPGAAWAQQVIGPVNVISMHDGSSRPQQALVVEGDRIIAVVNAPGPVVEGATLIDGQGAFVIPGLAEMHAHIPSLSRGEQPVRDVLALFLAHGITTVRGMLGEPWHLELRELLEQQAWPGPRLVTSGPSFNGNSVSSPAQAAKRVREQHAAGYDFLKLHPGLEPDEFRAIAATARELAIPFAGHVSFAVGLDAALATRQDTIDHLDGYAEQLVPPGAALHGLAPEWFGLNLAAAFDRGRIDALAQATAAAGVWNVPTQSLFETTAGEMSIEELLARPGMQYLGESLRGRWVQAVESFQQGASAEQRQAFLSARRALISALNHAGAPLLLGSDAPQIMNVPGISTHQELAYLVRAGLTPLQALQSGTTRVAQFLQRPDQGEVGTGMRADFILLQADPRHDILATRSILGVMRSGTWYDRNQLDRMLQDVEQRGL